MIFFHFSIQIWTRYTIMAELSKFQLPFPNVTYARNASNIPCVSLSAGRITNAFFVLLFWRSNPIKSFVLFTRFKLSKATPSICQFIADIKNFLFISSLAFVILTTSFVVAPTFNSPPSIQICNVLCPSKKSAISGSTLVVDGVLIWLSVISLSLRLVGFAMFFWYFDLSPFLPVKIGIPKSS